MPGLSSIPRFADEAPFPQDILEKPIDKDDNMRMLLDFNGGVCEVVTGVSIGTLLEHPFKHCDNKYHSCSLPRT